MCESARGARFCLSQLGKRRSVGSIGPVTFSGSGGGRGTNVSDTEPTPNRSSGEALLVARARRSSAREAGEGNGRETDGPTMELVNGFTFNCRRPATNQPIMPDIKDRQLNFWETCQWLIHLCFGSNASFIPLPTTLIRRNFERSLIIKRTANVPQKHRKRNAA